MLRGVLFLCDTHNRSLTFVFLDLFFVFRCNRYLVRKQAPVGDQSQAQSACGGMPQGSIKWQTHTASDLELELDLSLGVAQDFAAITIQSLVRKFLVEMFLSRRHGAR